MTEPQVGDTYEMCSHDLDELTCIGDEQATAICRRCAMRFRMCMPGCPSHPEHGGAWHYLGVARATEVA